MRRHWKERRGETVVRINYVRKESIFNKSEKTKKVNKWVAKE